MPTPTPTPPTQREIADFISDNSDIFNVTAEDLVEFLDYEHAIPFISDKFKAKLARGELKWEQKSIERSEVIEGMRSYMSFALGKAADHRGLSASRNIIHYRAWLFALGDQEALSYLKDDDNYAPYGVPMLKYVCDRYEFEYPGSEEWFQHMSTGEPCQSDCCEGCLS